MGDGMTVEPVAHRTVGSALVTAAEAPGSTFTQHNSGLADARRWTQLLDLIAQVGAGPLLRPADIDSIDSRGDRPRICGGDAVTSRGPLRNIGTGLFTGLAATPSGFIAYLGAAAVWG